MNETDRYRIFIRDMFTCQRCHKRFSGWQGVLQIAHRIKQGEGTLDWIRNEIERRGFHRPDKWIQMNVIDHPDNVATVCSLACNDSFNLFYNRIEADKLLDKILKNVLISDIIKGSQTAQNRSDCVINLEAIGEDAENEQDLL